MRPLEYDYPNQVFGKIHDQFMLGDKILVAPVLNKGERKRNVKLPEGKWKLPSEKTIKGGRSLEFELDELLYFTKM